MHSLNVVTCVYFPLATKLLILSVFHLYHFSSKMCVSLCTVDLWHNSDHLNGNVSGWLAICSPHKSSAKSMGNTNNTASSDQRPSALSLLLFKFSSWNAVLGSWLKTAKIGKDSVFTDQNKVAPRLEPPATLNNAMASYSCCIYCINKPMIAFRNNSWLCFSNAEAPSPPVAPCSSAAVSHTSHVTTLTRCCSARFSSST